MQSTVTVVGAGTAGLMAAEAAAGAGADVTIVDQRRSFGRTLLFAGRSGLNLTHAEPMEVFLGRYGDGRATLEPAIRAFPPDAVRAWADGLGADTFVGSSGRVFPAAMRAAGLLQAWTARLADLGVAMRTGETWAGFADDGATVLALGGASWPSVGGDGSWLAHVEAAGIPVLPFVASNAGVLVAWSAALLERFEGVPIKNAALRAGGRTVRGEPTITATGLEGGPIYALGPELRSGHGLEIDLQPDLDAGALVARLVDRRRPRDSMSTWLRKGGLSPVDVALLRDATGNRLPTDATAIADLTKAVPIPVKGLAPIDRAISTAGGVALNAIDDTGMLLDRPGTWVAGEMVAWDAPTGGYLIQACLSMGHRAGVAAARWAVEHP
jgi:uncharacterized flavoprotein (TIGR03862 family)